MESSQPDLFKKTTVVHCKRASFDIYIGRPSEWGNPYSHLEDGTIAKFKVKNRDEAISKYREYLLSNKELMASLPKLKGKVLGCWCHPKKCHGDVLAELADLSGETSETDCC